MSHPTRTTWPAPVPESLSTLLADHGPDPVQTAEVDGTIEVTIGETLHVEARPSPRSRWSYRTCPCSTSRCSFWTCAGSPEYGPARMLSSPATAGS